VLHGDNGATMKATIVLAMLHWLQIKPSYSRPRVSDDNAFIEALFCTAMYRPQFPSGGFGDLADTRRWAGDFVRWCNHDHRHSGIRYVQLRVTPVTIATSSRVVTPYTCALVLPIRGGGRDTRATGTPSPP
jgi:transposase InsO family protein